ncbi:MAG TPA: AI-2E family transporter, partial [Tepidisphaeraceae bacterium]|nr:AI-2E family transporter [Tepidisphaeraceae bacterium]
NALDLHPIVVLISLIFWSMIWGLAGAFLATPMTAVLKIVLEKIPATRPLAALLAGKLELVF